jgi:hypothetical protein
MPLSYLSHLEFCVTDYDVSLSLSLCAVYDLTKCFDTKLPEQRLCGFEFGEEMLEKHAIIRWNGMGWDGMM